MAPKLDRWLRLGALVFIASMLCNTAGFARTEPIGRVVEQVGDVTLVSLDRVRQSRAGIDVEGDDRVVTGAGAKVLIQLKDGSTLAIGPESELALADLNAPQGGWLELVRGIVRFILSPGARSGEVGVRTRAAVASVRSTEFVVEALPDRTAIFVVQGQVEVTGRLTGSKLALGPGEGTDVALHEAPTAPKRWGTKRVQDVMTRTTLP